ncbi:hypothetical protein SCHPADRAFT_932620 [Schizopora paradoxa]|uniref:Uncharacterized protein n=1 Tax=Schizopora paradoxa TaxID=27342 RepID=A0A0H2R751_9AGAM|nr:hypothetical protein SCHPADRAFT_932620 [Schizopora paradoxa]
MGLQILGALSEHKITIWTAIIAIGKVNTMAPRLDIPLEAADAAKLVLNSILTIFDSDGLKRIHFPELQKRHHAFLSLRSAATLSDDHRITIDHFKNIEVSFDKQPLAELARKIELTLAQFLVRVYLSEDGLVDTRKLDVRLNLEQRGIVSKQELDRPRKVVAQALVGLSPDVAKIFGAKEGRSNVSTIGHIVKNFRFSQLSAKGISSNNILHADLAPTFGQLDRDSMKSLDDELKITIAVVNRCLERMTAEEFTWERIISGFMQIPFVEPAEPFLPNIKSGEKLIRQEDSHFRFKKERRDKVAEDVSNWFASLIGDDDVVESTKLDIHVLADIIAANFTSNDGSSTFSAENDQNEKTVLDINVLRYPDSRTRYFKVYRIQLTAWGDSRRGFLRSKADVGISAVYNVRQFKPRSSYIAGLDDEVKAKAIAHAEALFV